MKQDKFLIGILIGIGVLVAAALAVFFIRQGVVPEYMKEDQPRGVVYNYILALHNGEYEKAYGYLWDGEGKPTLNNFQKGLIVNKPQWNNFAVDVMEESTANNIAVISVATTVSQGGIFNEGYRNTENATLEKVDGHWKIISMPYMYWSYDWYQPVIKQ